MRPNQKCALFKPVSIQVLACTCYTLVISHQRSWSLSQESLSHSVHDGGGRGCMNGSRCLLVRGGSLAQSRRDGVGMPGKSSSERYNPLKVHRLGTDIWRWTSKRTVRILLECCLVCLQEENVVRFTMNQRTLDANY